MNISLWKYSIIRKYSINWKYSISREYSINRKYSIYEIEMVGPQEA